MRSTSLQEEELALRLRSFSSVSRPPPEGRGQGGAKRGPVHRGEGRRREVAVT